MRDNMPLTPGTSVNVTSLDDKSGLKALTFAIYTAMDSMATSKYDRPTPADKLSWAPAEHLVWGKTKETDDVIEYSASVNQWLKLKNEAGRKDALSRIRGLVMLAHNLIVNYILMPPSKVIRKIEAARPASQPRLSPLPAVRRRWELDHMDVGDLRKTVLDRHRKGEDEREWLIKILMDDVKDDEGIVLVVNEDEDVVAEVEEGARVGGVKRKFEEDEEPEEV